MKWMVCVAVLVGGLLCPAVIADEPDLANDPEYQMELREQELRIQRMEDEAAFERQMNEMDLEARRVEIEHQGEDGDDGGGILLILIIVVHILVAVWVYQDIAARKCGSGIWVVIALIAGLVGTLVYAVVRIGDRENGAKNGSKK